MTSRPTVPRRPVARLPAAVTPAVTRSKPGARPAPAQPVKVRLRRWPRPGTLAGLAVAFIGLAMFLAGNIGARTGWVTLPGDPHHVLGQLVGITLFFVGVGLTSAKRSPKSSSQPGRKGT